MKIKDAIGKISSSLESMYSKSEAKSMAYLLTGHVLNLSKEKILASQETETGETSEKRILQCLEELMNWRPIQHILGDTLFYACTIRVNKDVLIPRPETEELVGMIINDQKNKSQKINILDIGTGSGCIAIALKKNLPASNVFALDVSEKALNVAKENATLNNSEIHFIYADILNPDVTIKIPEMDIMVSNPPYVRKSEKEYMKKNVLDFEPSLALFVHDEAPLLYYHAIAVIAVEKLKNGGALYLEINEALAPDTASVFQKMNFTGISTKVDIKGKPRFLSCVKP